MHRLGSTIGFGTLGVLLFAVAIQAPNSSCASDEPAGAAAIESGANSSAATIDFKPRKPAELRTAVSDALRAESAATNPREKDKAIRQLMLVYLELEQDQGLSHDQRRELHTTVRSRLQSVEKSLRAETARNRPAAKPNAKDAAKPKTIDASRPLDDVAVLAQQIAGPAVVPGAGQAVAPVAAFNRPVANGGVIGRLQPPDYGQDLVDLIHNVISPRTWDVNGGPGSVVYYRNLRVLVVRAPSEVQDQIGDVLGQLRK